MTKEKKLIMLSFFEGLSIAAISLILCIRMVLHEVVLRAPSQ
jgi:hypothetical protein